MPNAWARNFRSNAPRNPNGISGGIPEKGDRLRWMRCPMIKRFMNGCACNLHLVGEGQYQKNPPVCREPKIFWWPNFSFCGKAFCLALWERCRQRRRRGKSPTKIFYVDKQSKLCYDEVAKSVEYLCSVRYIFYTFLLEYVQIRILQKMQILFYGRMLSIFIFHAM